MEKEKEGDINF